MHRAFSVAVLLLAAAQGLHAATDLRLGAARRSEDTVSDVSGERVSPLARSIAWASRVESAHAIHPVTGT